MYDDTKVRCGVDEHTSDNDIDALLSRSDCHLFTDDKLLFTPARYLPWLMAKLHTDQRLKHAKVRNGVLHAASASWWARTFHRSLPDLLRDSHQSCLDQSWYTHLFAESACTPNKPAVASAPTKPLPGWWSALKNDKQECFRWFTARRPALEASPPGRQGCAFIGDQHAWSELHVDLAAVYPYWEYRPARKDNG
uniref:Uncharacterized protein n=1 Tax=Haptolina ericina TaxID=156174 RepID=A0A7S3EUD7_9EUKA|mmetsp:Transcript_25192/g.57357  ORF Transcript_25192/g.57357 Transcript_25192/m.57357 type:complete len:194 (+) Transcript_25192:245-826(+)